MSLGALLLDPEGSAAQLRGAPAAEPADEFAFGAEAAAAGGAAAAGEPGEERDDPEYVILWPALGCPGLVSAQDKRLDLIYLTRRPEAETDAADAMGLIRRIRLVEWERATAPYNQDNQPWAAPHQAGRTLAVSIEEGSAEIMTRRDLAVYREEVKKAPQQFGELLHTMPDLVPRIYLSKGYKTIAAVRVTLKIEDDLEPGKLFTLFYPPENGLLRQILADETLLEKPYDDVPLLVQEEKPSIGGPELVYRGRVGMERQREHRVRLFHPFQIVPEDRPNYLNVGHVTDLHLSTLWDFFDAKIFPHYAQDSPLLEPGRDPRANADSRFEKIATRYNNPNLNYRNLIQLLNGRSGTQRVDVILQTGDLVDFNRGFDFNPAHEPDQDYRYNLNWLRYYELLLLDYQRPTYTSLGNHDWRLNPYAPYVKGDASHFFIVLYVLLTLTAAGTACGATFGLFNQAVQGAEGAGLVLSFVGMVLLAPFAFILTTFLLVLALFASATDAPTAASTLNSFALLLWGGGFMVGVILFLLIFAINSDANAGEGAGIGALIGGSLGLIVAVGLSIFLYHTGKDYMDGVLNLNREDFEPLLEGKNVSHLSVVGADSLFNTTERSFDWYSLVINPFPDYAFRYGNMAIMMADWGGDEILNGDPPMAKDLFSERQWLAVQHLVEWSVERRDVLRTRGVPPGTQRVIPVLGLHSPVYCPTLDVDLDQLRSSGMKADAGALMRGTMDRHREDLVRLLRDLTRSPEPVLPINLSGHTHTYDLVIPAGEVGVKWLQTPDFQSSTADNPLFITTACAGPPADGKMPEELKTEIQRSDVHRELERLDQAHDSTYDATTEHVEKGKRAVRPSGCRVLTFEQASGRLTGVEEVSSTTAKWGKT